MSNANTSKHGNLLSTSRVHLVVLALSAVVLLLVDRSWPYPGGGTIDPWVYYGYFWDYPLYTTHLFADTYYGTRLPWILPGYVTVHLFPPMIGTFVFVLGVFYTAVYSFYFFITLLFNRHVGLFAALLLASDFYFLRPIAWYYVDGGVVLYLILTLLFLVMTHRYVNRWFPFLAAWACTSMVLCHFMSIVLLPGLLVYFGYSMLAAPQWNGRVGSGVRRVLMGSFSCGMFFGLINFAVARRLLFFMPQVRVLFFTHSIVTNYKLPVMVWLPRAKWDIIPGVAILIGVTAALMQFRRRDKLRGIHAVAVFAALGTFLMLLLAEQAGLFYYQISYYTSFLVPLCYVTIGWAIYKVTDGKAVPTLLIALVAFLMYWLRSRTDYEVGARIFRGSQWTYVALGAMAVLTAIALLPFLGKAWRARFVIFVLGLAACSMEVGERGFFGPAFQWELLHQAHGQIRAIAGQRLPRLWYGPGNNEFLSMWRSLASIYLWGFSIVNEDYPRTTAKGFGPIQSGDLVVVCSESAGLAEEARQSLAKRSLSWNEIRKERVERDGRGFWMTMGEVRPLEVQGGGGAK
jgi:hypothetical protein